FHSHSLNQSVRCTYSVNWARIAARPRREDGMTDKVERQREIVAKHIRGENEHDWASVYDTFVQDDRAHYDVVPLGASFKGIEGVRDFYQTIATAFPDVKIEVLTEYDVEGCSIREVVISGRHVGEFAGVQPHGNAVRFELAAFYTFDA